MNRDFGLPMRPLDRFAAAALTGLLARRADAEFIAYDDLTQDAYDLAAAMVHQQRELQAPPNPTIAEMAQATDKQSIYIHDDDGTECKDIESCTRLNSRHVWSSSALLPEEVNKRLMHALYLAEKRRADSLEAALRDLRGEGGLYAALKKAVDIIRCWHGLGMPIESEETLWNIYRDNSPEMQPLIAALTKAEGLTR